MPDLRGCVATGKGVDDVEPSIRQAIEFHIEGLRESGEPVPPPTAVGTTIVEMPSAS